MPGPRLSLSPRRVAGVSSAKPRRRALGIVPDPRGLRANPGHAPISLSIRAVFPRAAHTVGQDPGGTGFQPVSAAVYACQLGCSYRRGASLSGRVEQASCLFVTGWKPVPPRFCSFPVCNAIENRSRSDECDCLPPTRRHLVLFGRQPLGQAWKGSRYAPPPRRLTRLPRLPRTVSCVPGQPG
jgi:hypothetical protein